MLHSFAAKAALADTVKILKRNGYTIAELNKRYQQRFEKPILKTETFTKGVYKTSNEFISNNPSIKEYEFKKDKKATILYTKTANNEWSPARTAYGFCDGKTIWINVNNIFHPLIRQGNTFEFIADLKYARRLSDGGIFFYTGLSPASIALTSLLYVATTSHENHDSGRSVYQLNLETGEYY